MDGLELVEVRESAHAFPPHTHDHYLIGAMERGAVFCDANRDKNSLRPGEIFLVNPGQIHSGVPAPGSRTTYQVFHIEPHWLRQVAGEISLGRPGDPEFKSMVVRAPLLHQYVQRLSRLVVAGAEPLAKESTMVGVLSSVLLGYGEIRPREPEPGREPGAVRRTREFLAERLDARVSLEDLAQAANLSRYHLLRVFKRATGLTPHAFHVQSRVERAKSLLRSGLPIVQVAADTGFVDQSHFTRAFKHLVGATPGQYLGR
jgi:AraC-like DNA-binding protein